MPLKLASERVGYEIQAGFLRAFKQVLGKSPTAWRRETDGAEKAEKRPGSVYT